MRQLHFYYRINSGFTSSITGHSFSLKCIPQSNPVQEIDLIKETIAPEGWCSFGKDSFGNSYQYGHVEEAHDYFQVEIEGYAKVHRTERKIVSKDKLLLYRFPTALTVCSDEMKQLADDFYRVWMSKRKGRLSFRDIMYALMEKVFSYMEYRPGTTNIRTKAAEAFAAQKGVCQDYSHILIALCRYLSIPAAYVAGYMYGEGASHAWVAVCDEISGRWYELDPTNDRLVDDSYIDVSHGLDAADCVINKGLYKGMAVESQEMTVIVEDRI